MDKHGSYLALTWQHRLNLREGTRLNYARLTLVGAILAVHRGSRGFCHKVNSGSARTWPQVYRRDTTGFARSPPKDNYKGIPVYRFPFWTTLTDRNAVDRLTAVRRQVIQLKRILAPDLVHIHGFGPTSVLFHLDTTSAYPTPLLVTLINELSGRAAGHESLRRVLRSVAWVTGKAKIILTQACHLVPEITPHSRVPTIE